MPLMPRASRAAQGRSLLFPVVLKCCVDPSQVVHPLSCSLTTSSAVSSRCAGFFDGVGSWTRRNILQKSRSTKSDIRKIEFQLFERKPWGLGESHNRCRGIV